MTFTVPIGKKVTRIDENGEKITKNIYLTEKNLLIAQDLWQAYYQTLSIIFLKEFIKLNLNLYQMTKNVKFHDFSLKQTNFKDDLIKYKCLCCSRNYQQKFDEELKERVNTCKFSNHINSKFVYFIIYFKLFTLTCIWMDGKN